MLFAAGVLAATSLSTHSASYGSTRSAATSLVDQWISGTTSAPVVKASLGPLTADHCDDPKGCLRLQAWCGGHFLLSGCSGGDCGSTIAARCFIALGKFRKLLPVLTSRHLCLEMRGKVYMACVRSSMLHGCKTWGPNILDLKRFCHNDCAMIR